MGNEFCVNIKKDDKAAILNFQGDLTTFAEEEVNKAIDLCSADCKNLLINFEKVDYINSAGIAILIGIVTEMMKKGGSLKLFNVSSHYQKVFKMVGITQYSAIYNNVEEALGDIKSS
jgi:anti-anti-sigma factor